MFLTGFFLIYWFCILQLASQLVALLLWPCLLQATYYSPISLTVLVSPMLERYGVMTDASVFRETNVWPLRLVLFSKSLLFKTTGSFVVMNLFLLHIWIWPAAEKISFALKSKKFKNIFNDNVNVIKILTDRRRQILKNVIRKLVWKLSECSKAAFCRYQSKWLKAELNMRIGKHKSAKWDMIAFVLLHS